MIEHLKLDNVGPAPEMALDFAPRLNLLTGDNGLGKSFLLDVVWWTLTRRWPREVNRRMTSGHLARPHNSERTATMEFSVRSHTRSVESTADFFRPEQAWLSTSGRPQISDIVVYAHADGSFSVWDPARNYRIPPISTSLQDQHRPAYVFTEAEVCPRTDSPVSWTGDGFRSATGCCLTGRGGFRPIMTTPRPWPRSCGRCLQGRIRTRRLNPERPCAFRSTTRARFRPS